MNIEQELEKARKLTSEHEYQSAIGILITVLERLVKEQQSDKTK